MDIIDCRDATEITMDLVGDLSASRRSKGYRIGNIEGLSFEAIWPATGTPVGSLALEVLNDPSQSTGETHPAFALAAVVAAQPSGGAGRLFVDNIKTGAVIVCASYTRTSGGTGAHPKITLGIKRG